MISEDYYFKSGKDACSNFYYVFIDKTKERWSYLFNHPKLEILEKLKTNYTLKRLIDVCSEPMCRGKQPEYAENGDVLVIKTIDLHNSYIDYENCLSTTKDFFNKVPNAQVRRGDILIASTGYGSLGKVDVYERDEDAVVDGHITILRLINNYDTYFVVFFLRSQFGQLQFEKWFSGSSGQIEIQPDDLNKFIIPESSENGVPLIKQTEMTTEVNKKLTDASELEMRANDILGQTENLLLSELGVETPTTTKIDYYVKNIDDVNSRLDTEFNNPKYDCIATVISNSGVTFVELPCVVDFMVDTKNPLRKPDESFKYVDIGNIDTRWGRVNAIEMLGRQATSSRVRRVMYKDSVLVSTTRPTRNAIALVPDELDGEICSTGLAVLKCKSDMDNKFLFYSLRTNLSRIQFEKYCSGSGYPEINHEMDLPKIKIPKPDLPIQSQIVKKIEKALKVAEKSEVTSNRKKQEAESIFMQEILKKRQPSS